MRTDKKWVRLTSQPYQNFVICADRVASETPAFITLAEDGKQTYSYQLTITEPETTLEILHPKTCTVDNSIYPYHFLDLLHSEKPFLAVEGKPEYIRQNTSTNNGGGLPPSFLPSEGTILTEGGGGFSFDDDQQHKKRPPWIPFQTSDAYSLMVLPALRLPEGLRDFIPGTRLYYDLLDQLGYSEEINIILRTDGHKPVSIPVRRDECSELAEYMTSAPALLNWLTSKLNGREQLVDLLLDVQTHFDGSDTASEKEFLEAVEKQLASVLEQNDSEFNLQFELDWLESLTRKEQIHDSVPDIGVIYDGGEISKLLHQGMNGQGSIQKRGNTPSSTGQQSSDAGSSGRQDRVNKTGFSSEEEGGQSGQADKGDGSVNNDRQKDTAQDQGNETVDILFLGPFSTGKTSLINAILGYEKLQNIQDAPTLEEDPVVTVSQVRFRSLIGTGHEDNPTSEFVIRNANFIGNPDVIVFVMQQDLSSESNYGLLDQLKNKVF